MKLNALLSAMNDGERASFENTFNLYLWEKQDGTEEFNREYRMYEQQLTAAYNGYLRRNCGQLDVVYENIAEFLEEYRVWAYSRQYIWKKLLRSIAVTYNLIHNTDKTQEETTTTISSGSGMNTGNRTNTASSSGTFNANNSNSANDNQTVTNNESNLHQVSAANQTDFHNKHKDTKTVNNNVGITHSGTDKRNENTSSSGSGSEESESNFSEERESEVVHKIRAYGNIGVTTNQQMLEEERKSALFDVAHFMVDDFKKEFCIMIY